MSRISPGTLLLGIVAVLFGLLGAYVVRENLRKPNVAKAAPEKKTFVVPRAGFELKSGRKIALGDIMMNTMTAAEMSSAGLTDVYMPDARQIIGRVLRSDVKAGSTFSTSMFYPEGTGPNVAELLEPGERAITVPVESDSAVAGFTRPGTWVDVIFTSEEDEERERPETTITLLEKVKVLAVNQQTFENAKEQDNKSTDSVSVTLAVNVEDAAALRVVDGHGALSLVLRNPEDTLTTASLAPRTMDELLKLPPPVRHRIEIFRGNSMSQTDFKYDKRVTPPVVAIAGDDKPAAPAAAKPRRTPR